VIEANVGAAIASKAAGRSAIAGRSVLALPTLLSAVATLSIILGFVFLSLDVPSQMFRSPDENANFIFTRTLADSGELAYTADFLETDAENLLHPRGALTLDDKAVPFNFLGLPILYAPAYKLLGHDLRYVALPLTAVSVISMAGAGALLAKERPWVAWLGVLGMSPFIAIYTRPFLNVLPSLAFMSAGAYFLIKYYQSGGIRKHLVLASVAFALAAWMRYELVIFQSLIIVIVTLQCRKSFWPAILDMALYAITTGAIFLGPLLVANTLIYGSPLDYGYSLFNEVYFPERASGESPLDAVRSILLPAYPLDMHLATRAFANQVFGVAPLIVIGAGLGVWAVLKENRPATPFLIAYGILGLYVYLYRGAGYSWAADLSAPTLEASVIRYSVPLYLGFYLLAVHGMGKGFGDGLPLACLAMMAVISMTGLARDLDGNPLFIRDRLNGGSESTKALIAATEPDSIIYTDIYDKVLATQRNVATWWGGSLSYEEGHFKPAEVAASMNRVVPHRKVYLIVSEERMVLEPLNVELARFDLVLQPNEFSELYVLEHLPVTGNAP
jgi:hypothetical protein